MRSIYSGAIAASAAITALVTLGVHDSAHAANTQPVLLRATGRSIINAALFPRAGVFYTLTQGEDGQAPTVEMRKLVDGSLLRTVHVCAVPHQLAGVPKRGLVYVACEVGDDNDDPTTIVVLDAASGKIKQITAHKTEVALAIDEASDLPYQLVAGERIFRIDVRTGRMTAAPGACDGLIKVSEGRLYCWDDRTRSVNVVDYASGRLLERFTAGAFRRPPDLVVAPTMHKAYAPFSAAGSIGMYDTQTGRFQAAIAAADSPLAVFADEGNGRVLALTAARHPQRTALEIFDVNGSRKRELVLNHDWPVQRDEAELQAQIRRDSHSGRYIIGDANALTIVSADARRVLYAVRLPGSGLIRQLTFDDETGIAYAVWNADYAGFFVRIDARRTSYAPPTAVGVSTLELRRSSPDISDEPRFLEPQPPPFSAPPGLRTPRWLAAGPGATIAVSFYGERVIGLIKNGTYTQRSLNIRGATAYVSVDQSGTIWFSEYTSGDSQYIGCLRPTGAVREFRLPPVSGGASTGSVHLGEIPITLVNGADGYEWGFDPTRGIVWRIDGSGKAVATVLSPHGENRDAYNEEASIVARARGGVYVAVDRIWRVATDGTAAELVPPAGLGAFGTLAALPTGGFRFVTTDAIATVSPDGGMVGLPVDRWIVKQQHVRQANGTVTTTTGAICRPHAFAVLPSSVDWFACANSIVRVDEGGSARFIAMPLPRTYPTALTVSSDGSIWFAEPLKSKLGRIDQTGKITELAL